MSSTLYHQLSECYDVGFGVECDLYTALQLCLSALNMRYDDAEDRLRTLTVRAIAAVIQLPWGSTDIESIIGEHNQMA